ncbi:M16 family metallopeptidase [Pseudemcibacter aquimaris]|uniref:M16 family metallopeptidase n=1 Tax=Pseudemcibacter aquimaris TaxID=2857064 RepID=UPI002012AF06|nr:pitrilysin family protein [Pseudemcibacter aquimaris]MCC3862458.1 insulinase family protein [Pseudemcibacter aquimaris]WDU59114.1 insulinase family protein [Pseudemcibacter aquimaris]
MSVRSTTLNNGLRVVTDHMPHVETVTVGTWVDVGSRFESASENGLSHMLEHMAFKGTDRRSALDIAEEIENVGGYLNAYTSREQTTYYARLLKDDLALGVDMLGDILQNSTFEQDELERERGVIIQEIGQAEDTPDDIIFDLMQDAAYPDQPLGRPILGTTDLVNAYSRDDLNRYMKGHYRFDTMAVVGAGNLDHDDFVKMVEKGFSSFAAVRDYEKNTAKYVGGDKRVSKELEQVNLLFGFEGVSYDDPDYYAAQVMSMIFGGGMSSRLFQEVREKRGLVYSIYSYNISYVDGGTFGIHAGTGPDQTAELIPVVATEFKKMADHIADQEIMRAKAQLKAGILMSLENTTSRMEQLGRQQMIFNRHIPREEIIEKIEAVDAAQIKRVTERFLSKSDLSFGAIGPLMNIDPYDKVSAFFS